MKKLNIIFWGNISYPNGMAATHRIQHFVSACERRDFKTHILIPFFYEFHSNLREGIHGKTKYSSLIKRSSYKFINLFKLPIMLIKGMIYIKKNKALFHRNVFYIYDGISLENILVVLFAKWTGFKIYIDVVEDYSLHEESISFLLEWKLKTLSILEKYTSRFVDGVIVISKYLEKKYINLIKKNTKILLIPISATIPMYIQKTKWNDPIQIVYSGSYGKKDAVAFLIEAFLQAINQTHLRLELFLLGSGSNKKEIRKYKEYPFINYVGYVADDTYYEFLKNADILCMTRTGSKYANAGFPFKLGEYLATGNPIIASNVSDISYYLKDKKDIVLSEPESVESIKNALVYILEDFHRARKIGNNGYEKCKIFFNEINNGDKFIGFIS